MIGTTISHYRILGSLGSGGMGDVYKAEDTLLKRTVAIKFLPPGFARDSEAKERFIHEAQAASALDHNNICVIHEVGQTDDGQSFIVMTYYDGSPLKNKIEDGNLRIEDGIHIAIQIAQGLAKAHEHGIVHRDIKPANIIITADGVAKIVDFGLAKRSGRTQLTREGTTLGTAAYMSPEQAKGESVDRRTDIWSLGVVIYELITGQLPFKGEYDNALIYSILNAEPEPMTALRTGVPMELERIVQKCLSKNPDDRYQHVDELLVDLRSCGKPGSRPSSSVPLSPAPRRKSKILWYGIGAAVLVLALALFLLTNRETKPVSHPKMIAVLPFENLGPAEDEYFADGLTDEITSRLSTVRGLGVISRTSAMQYKKTTKALPAIARELGVDYVLDGTVRWVKTGDAQRIRITPELISVSGDVHLWADNIDRTLNDIFAIQTEIATQVVNSLDIVLNENQRRTIGAVPTQNLEAYQTYLRGLAFVEKIDRPNIETAIALFQRAVELDSAFALAYTQLAVSHMYYFWLGFDPSNDRLALARTAIDRAFSLQADLPEAFDAQGMYYLFGFRDYDRALKAYAAAEERDPNNRKALEYVAYILRRQGKFEETIERLKKVCELDPQNAIPVIEIGNTYRMLADYPQAESYLDRAIAINPDYTDEYVWKGAIPLAWRGDTRQSRSEFERVPKQFELWFNMAWLDIYDRNYQAALDRVSRAPASVFEGNYSFVPLTQLRALIYRFLGDSVRSRLAFDSARVFLVNTARTRPDDFRIHMSLGIVYAGLGESRSAVAEADRSIELLPISRDAWAGVFPVINKAQVCAMAGMNEAACKALETALSAHASKELTVPMLRLDPFYDPLRSSPEFQALLRKYK